MLLGLQMMQMQTNNDRFRCRSKQQTTEENTHFFSENFTTNLPVEVGKSTIISGLKEIGFGTARHRGHRISITLKHKLQS